MTTINNAYLNLVKSSNKRPLSEDDTKYIPRPFREVAEGMEKQFAEFMINQMKKTSGESEGDSGMSYYKSLLTSERANSMTQNNGGLGLQKLILDQVYPKRFRNPQAYAQYEAQGNANVIKKSKIERHDHPRVEITQAKKEVINE